MIIQPLQVQMLLFLDEVDIFGNGKNAGAFAFYSTSGVPVNNDGFRVVLIGQ